MALLKASIAIVLIAVGLYFLKQYCGGGVCHSKARLDGKTVVITGGNTGIGKETAIDLAKRGAKVIIACRSKERGENAVKDIRKESGNEQVYTRLLDLASYASIRKFADGIISSEPKLDILINNAAVMMCPFWKTEDGHEMQFGVNHLGHFLLTNLLLELIKKSAPSRIINVSSMAHRWPSTIDFDQINNETAYSPYYAYGTSKLANVLFSRELHQRLKDTSVSVFSLHPGAVNTELARHIIGDIGEFLATPVRLILFKTPQQGAQTSICCAVDDDVLKLSGEYFSDCAMKPSSPAGNNMELARKLWDYSMKVTHLQ